QYALSLSRTIFGGSRTMIETAEIPPAVITPEMEALFKVLEEQHGYDRLDLEEMLAFMQAGGTYGEFFGYSPEIYNSIEEIALTHYRAQQYDKALTIF